MKAKIKSSTPSLFEALAQNEKQCISEATAAGYYSPYESDDVDLKYSLSFENDGRKFRRFITQFGSISTKNLEDWQTRKKVYDIKDLEEGLLPRIQRDGRMYNPITTIESVGSGEEAKEEVINGHGRLYCHKKIFGPETPIAKIGRAHV